LRDLLALFKKVLWLFSFAPTKAELSYLLAQASAPASLEEKILWLQKLVEWVRYPSAPSEVAEKNSGEIKTVRLRFVLLLLERNPAWKSGVAVRLRSILRETSAVELFCQTGLTQESGFLGEAISRILKKIIPAPPAYNDLAEVFALIFALDSDADWIRDLPEDLMLAVLQLFVFEAEEGLAFVSLKNSMKEALLILGAQASALGTSPAIRQRLPSHPISESPFLNLATQLQELLMQNAEHSSTNLPSPARCLAEIEKCRVEIQQVFVHLEKSGVSVPLVYQLENTLQSLERIEMILKLLNEQSVQEDHALMTGFVADLIRGEIASRTLTDLIHTNTHMISRKVVERTGFTGEHYIMQNRQEYRAMLGSAAGGGILTVFTAVAKYFILNLKMALFFEGVFTAFNYSGSFVLMQLCGFTLATKQPSMTASALAAKLKMIHSREDVDSFLEEFLKITRSQFAAAVGNLGLVIPGAILFNLGYVAVFGHPVFDEHFAQHSIEMINPLTSLTIPFAILTGILLWISSLTAGWIENWTVYRRIPEAIAASKRLQAVFGSAAANKVSHWFSHQISGLAGNTSLGVYLAFTPVIGRFFGLPLDVRHVTLSTGAVTLGICALGPANIGAWTWVSVVTGIAIIGLLNFGVSFALALWVATRARNVKRVWIGHFLKAALRRFLRQPWTFLFFPRKQSV
jgi:site-specific recombinase